MIHPGQTTGRCGHPATDQRAGQGYVSPIKRHVSATHRNRGLWELLPDGDGIREAVDSDVHSAHTAARPCNSRSDLRRSCAGTGQRSGRAPRRRAPRYRATEAWQAPPTHRRRRPRKRRRSAERAPSALGVLWDFPGTSGPINRHERETTESPLARLSGHHAPIAAGHSASWSLPGQLIMAEPVVGARRRDTAKHRSGLPVCRGGTGSPLCQRKAWRRVTMWDAAPSIRVSATASTVRACQGCRLVPATTWLKAPIAGPQWTR